MSKLPALSDQPLKYAACYALDLYCDHYRSTVYDGVHGFDEFPHQFTGETFAQCAKKARYKGWTIHKETRTATCPKCTRLTRRARL